MALDGGGNGEGDEGEGLSGVAGRRGTADLVNILDRSEVG